MLAPLGLVMLIIGRGECVNRQYDGNMDIQLIISKYVWFENKGMERGCRK